MNYLNNQISLTAIIKIRNIRTAWLVIIYLQHEHKPVINQHINNMFIRYRIQNTGNAHAERQMQSEHA